MHGAIQQIRREIGLRARTTGNPTARATWRGAMAHNVLGLLLVLALPGGAQNPGLGQDPHMWQPVGQRLGSPMEDPGNGDPAEVEKRLRALNAERQRSMVADTNKLLKLAQELEGEINRESPDALTPNQLRKVADIEKLAHSIKEKMSTSVRGAPEVRIPFPSVIR